MQVFESKSNIDLRYHIYKILRGADGNPGIGQLLIHRKVRQDSNGDYIRCVCYDKTSGDHGIDNCPYCHGLGYLFDDSLVLGYIVERISSFYDKEKIPFDPGIIDSGKHYVILEWTTHPSEKDLILEPMYDTENNIIQPVKIYRKWKISAVNPIRGDYGRVEYYVCIIDYYKREGRHDGV